MADLKRSKSKEFPYVVGVTNWDICITKKNKDGSIKKPISKYTDFGIFGLGKCPGSVCVLSLFRLRNAENTVTLERIQKIAIHEIGHNHGLKHCPNPGCVMQDAAEKMSTIDQVKPSLCEECLNRIQ